jgi:hypothetical protein
MFHDGRNSNRCDSETYKNTHMSKVGGRKRKKVQYLINTEIIQNKTTEGESCSPALIHGQNTTQNQETPGSSCGVKDRDRDRKENGRLHQRTNMKKLVQYMIIEK